MSETDTINSDALKAGENDNFLNNVATNPITTENKKSETKTLMENFDNNFELAIKLMAGDKLLRPYASNSIVRKTSTQGIYKVLIKTSNGSQIKILDESQLFQNKKIAAGSISKLGSDAYEIVSFDEDDNMEINHFDKLGAIEFLNKNKMIL